VSAAPLQKLTTFLAFDRDAEEAMMFYISLFKDSEVLNTIRARKGEPGWVEGTLQHAIFSIAGQQLMCINKPQPGARGSDHARWADFSFSPSMALYVQCESEEEIDRLFEALSEQGETLMPLGDYGYSAKFGWVNDRFGVSWRLNLSADAEAAAKK
jgi:predicted 3-demethylubiquinone-9 3-methyltransferase (glyoxalase superfamily)